eukprot:4396687-Pyramimonas_sp.AAC.1
MHHITKHNGSKQGVALPAAAVKLAGHNQGSTHKFVGKLPTATTWQPWQIVLGRLGEQPLGGLQAACQEMEGSVRRARTKATNRPLRN